MAEERSHAKLSASGAKRWMACPRSVSLEALFPEVQTSFSEEGTKAHALAEINLKYALGLIKADDMQRELAELIGHLGAIDDEMEGYVDKYVSYCLARLESEKAVHPDAYAVIEQRLDFSSWVPEGFGTGDFMILSPDNLISIDLKYGRGVEVSAMDNPQTRLYALGGHHEYGWIYPFKKVEMHIFQPRINNYSVEVLSVDELLSWGVSIIPLADDAYNDRGIFQPGDHCKFCKARGLCRARASILMGNLENELKSIQGKED